VAGSACTHARTLVAKAGSASWTRSQEHISLLRAFMSKGDAFDLQARVFGVKMNEAMAQKIVATVLGSILTLVFKMASATVGIDEAEGE